MAVSGLSLLRAGRQETALPPAFPFPLASRGFVRFIFREYALPALLLGVTLLTTTADGARFMQNFLDGMPPAISDLDLWPWPWLAHHPHLYLSGLAFSVTLLGILLTHEFGHYLACRVHGIRATLPWVLPAPTLSGTAGAVIRIRSRIADRNALMDVGIYGPLAGYVASVAAITAGFLHSTFAPADAAGAVRLGGEPLTLGLLHSLLLYWKPGLPKFEQLSPHPVLIAGWIGLFITALNLLPGGQLDGGHILYSVSPRLHRVFTRLLPFVLLAAGVFFWVGWILWGLILLLPAMRHPRVPAETELTRSRAVLAGIGLGLLVLTFTPTPFHGNSLLEIVRGTR